MKKIAVFLIVLIGLFSFASCDKNNDPDNHFTYGGKNYMIDSAGLTELVFNNGLDNEFSVFQFVFNGILGTDTADLIIAVYDTLSTTLGGNYPSIDQMALEDNSRGIFPFGFFFGSAIVLTEEIGFWTGDGGSIDVSVADGNNYTIDLNDISAGIYGDLFDEDINGDAEYTETGKIGGFYKGTLIKYTEIMGDTKSAHSNPLIERILKAQKKVQ